MRETAVTPVPEGGPPGPAPAPAAPPPRRAAAWRRPGRLLAVAALLALILLGAGLAAANLWALHHYRAARAELGRYHTAAARAHLEECLRFWPREPDALLLAARAARRSGSFDGAEHFLARAEKAGAREDDLTLERVLLRAERGDVDEVRPFCDRLIEGGGPGAALALEALTKGLLRTYRAGEALAALDRWDRLEPDSAQAALLRGALLDQADRRHDALAGYRRAVQLDPEYDEARLRLAGLLVLTGQYAEAVPHLEYLRGRLPGDPRVETHLARCRAQAGQAAEAVELLEGVLGRWPHFAPALAERGKLALQEGDLPRAEACLSEAAARAPDDVQARYQLHLCLSRQGKTEEAARAERRLLQMESDIKRLQEIAQGEMQRSPHSAALQCEVGAILLRGGQAAEGLRWLHRALQEDPGYAPAHQALADFYLSTGERALATRHRELARAGKR
jgi:tetratricopeptide (TPR) repeat protein